MAQLHIADWAYWISLNALDLTHACFVFQNEVIVTETSCDKNKERYVFIFILLLGIYTGLGTVSEGYIDYQAM